jgi:hypothetical protein
MTNRLRLHAFVLIALIPGSVPALAQSEDLMQREIDQALEASLWRAGPFRLTPQIRIAGGYDSNAVSSPEFPVEDLMFLVAPGVRAVVPMGNKGLVDLFQELDFVYYRDLEQLRDVFNVSRAGGAFGGRDFVLRGEGEFRKEKVRPTSELDIPLDQDTRRLAGDLDLALGSRQELTLRYQNARFRYQDPETEDAGVSVPSRLDRTVQDYRLVFTRHVTATTSAVVEGLFDVIDYVDDATERDGRGYGGLAGLSFSPRGDIRGDALFGYKRQVPDVSTQAEYSGFIASADVRIPLGKRVAMRALFSRDTQPSVLENNWFFVENRIGGSFDIYFAERLFIRPGAVVGRNTYPRPSRFINADGEEVVELITDDFQIYSFSINYHLRPDLIAQLGGNYWIRDSNFPRFSKDRFVVTVGITTEF